jgi:hypothetical protein
MVRPKKYVFGGLKYETGGPVAKAVEKTLTIDPDADPETMFYGRYNTPLTKREQEHFDNWAIKQSERQGRNILMDKGAYDIQGFWKAGDWKRMDADNHGTDTWKKPNHPTFSNHSRYHGADGWYGGNWTEEAGYQPSKKTANTYSQEYYSYLFGNEPNRLEHIDMSRYDGKNLGTPVVYENGGFTEGDPITDPNARKKKKKNPIFTSDPNNIRLKQYSDSLDVYNLSNQVQRIYPNLPQIPKDKFDEIEEKEGNLTKWEIDEVKYKEDKKKKKKDINLEDYVYSTKRKDFEDPRRVANMEEFNSKMNTDPAAIEKFIITLPNGDMKIPNYLWEGKPDWEDYIIVDAKTNTSRWYSKDYNGKTRLLGAYPVNNKPIETKYYGKDAPVEAGSIQFNSEEFKNNKLTKAQQKQWQNYIYENESMDFYEKPTQPVIYKKGYKGQEPPTDTTQKPTASKPTAIPYKGDPNRRQYPIKLTGDAAADRLNMQLFGQSGSLTDNGYIPLNDPKYNPYIGGIGPKMKVIKTPAFAKGGFKTLKKRK